MPERRKTTSKKPVATLCASKIEESTISSPLGNIKVTMCEEGLHSISLEGDISDENFSPNKREVVRLMDEDNAAKTEVLQDCLYWFQSYFDNPSLMPTVHQPKICYFTKPDPSFRVRVWQSLKETVGPGEVISYGDLAASLGSPGAARAVGSAMSNNPIGIIVPCHRVVRSNGMGLYHGGKRQAVKKWLLRHEGVDKF